MMANINNLKYINMSTLKKSFFMVMMSFALTLVGCSSDTKLRESLNEYVNGMTNKFFLTGRFVFDENVIDPNLGKITIEMLYNLQEEGLIKYTVIENQGSIHEVDLSLTDKGMKYAKNTDDEHVFIVRLYNEKVGDIIEKDFNEEYGVGRCYFSTVYDEVTPFGKIMDGIKSGDVSKAKRDEKVKKIDGQWQAEYPSWKEKK